MFGYGYKEDALKWREHLDRETNKEMSRKFRMVIEVTLKDGDTQYKTYERQGYATEIGNGRRDWVVTYGREVMNNVYLEEKEYAGKCGIEVDSGMFIPHSNIHHIRKMSVIEVQE